MTGGSEGEVETYRFPPLDRGGVLMGMPATPVLTLAAGLVLAVVALAALPGVLGLAVGAGLVAAALVAACWPVAGDPPVRWVPVIVGWALRRPATARLDPAPGRGQVARAGAAVPAPPVVTAGTRATARARTTAPAGLRLRRLPAIPGEVELGVVEDCRSGRWSAVLPVNGRSLALLDPEDQSGAVARWGGVLAAAAREGGGIRRLQWVQRSAPADPAPLLAAAAAAPGPEAATRSYQCLVAREAPAAREQRTLLVVSVAGPRTLPGRRPASRPDDVLRREVRLVAGQLRAAGLASGAPLGPGQLAAELAAAADPTVPRKPGPPASPWPGAISEGWSSLRVDATWQAVYWVAEWPRLPVGPDVLSPLLATGPARTLAVTMAPVAPDRAVREAQSARTAGLADDALRARAGFVTTARRSREAEAVRRREFELADGHGDYRFCGYLGVAAASAVELEARCGELEQAASATGLVLRRLHGRQAEAHTWLLPIGRGLS